MFSKSMFDDGNNLDENKRIKRQGYSAMPSYGNKLITNMGGLDNGTTVKPPSYLRQSNNGIANTEANNEIANTGANGNITTPEANEIKDQMSYNSQAWYDSTPEQQKVLEQKNQELGAKLRGMGVNAVFDSESGSWSYDPVLQPQQPQQPQQQANPYTSTVSSDNVAIRKTLNGFGITDDRIGWIENPNGGGTVTVDGKAILTTNDLRDGSSYASSSNISNGTVSAMAGNGVIAAADYLANSNLPFSIGYNNGMVDIGGVLIKPTAVINGKAYVSKSDMDRAINKSMSNAGINTNQSIVNKQANKYNGYYDNLLENIADRDGFSYNPETDPVYQAYKQLYTREGNRATENAIGNMAGLTGGYTNSAAITAGGQANNYYMQKLTDAIPELYNSAYNRYVDDFNMDKQALNSVMDIDNMEFGRNYTANRDTIGDVRYNNDTNYQRGRDAVTDARYNDDTAYNRGRDAVGDNQWDKNYNLQKEQWDKNYNLQQDQWDVEKKIQEQAYQNQEKLNAQNDAERRGYYTAEEAAILGVPQNADPYNYDKQKLERELEYQKSLLSAQTEQSKSLTEYEYSLKNKYSGSSGSSGGGGGSSRSGGSSSSSNKGSSSGSESYGISDSSSDRKTTVIKPVQDEARNILYKNKDIQGTINYLNQSVSNGTITKDEADKIAGEIGLAVQIAINGRDPWDVLDEKLKS